MRQCRRPDEHDRAGQRRDDHRSRWADLASLVTSRASAAKLFTTRTPCTFSSTMVVISAARACTIHESGNSRLRRRIPTASVNGNFPAAADLAERALRLLPNQAEVKWYSKQALLADRRYDRLLGDAMDLSVALSERVLELEHQVEELQQQVGDLRHGGSGGDAT